MRIDRQRLSPIIRVCIEIIENAHANPRLVDVAGKLISAEALFNDWVYTQKDESHPNVISEDEFLKILDLHENLGQSFEESFVQFCRDPQENWEALVAAADATKEKLLIEIQGSTER